MNSWARVGVICLLTVAFFGRLLMILMGKSPVLEARNNGIWYSRRHSRRIGLDGIGSGVSVEEPVSTPNEDVCQRDRLLSIHWTHYSR